MRKEEKIISFNLALPEETRITHGYNILNDFPVHFHSSFTLGKIENGERLFNYRDEKIILRKGDVFLIQPFEPHSCTSQNKQSHSYKISSFNFNKNIFNPYFPSLLIRDSLLGDRVDEFHTVAEYDMSSDRLSGLFDNIKNNLLKYAEEKITGEENKKFKKGITAAKEYLEENCTEPLKLKDAADIAGLSEFHFNRVFHEMIGMSPYAYFIFCRVKKSQQVLFEGGNITQTAYETGFFDQSHFIKHFKKHTGVTPGKFILKRKSN